MHTLLLGVVLIPLIKVLEFIACDSFKNLYKSEITRDNVIYMYNLMVLRLASEILHC